MMPMYDPHPWSKQRREEVLREVQRRTVAKRAKRNGGTRFEFGRVSSALSGVLSCLGSLLR